MRLQEANKTLTGKKKSFLETSASQGINLFPPSLFPVIGDGHTCHVLGISLYNLS